MLYVLGVLAWFTWLACITYLHAWLAFFTHVLGVLGCSIDLPCFVLDVLIKLCLFRALLAHMLGIFTCSVNLCSLLDVLLKMTWLEYFKK